VSHASSASRSRDALRACSDLFGFFSSTKKLKMNETVTRVEEKKRKKEKKKK
jgi:hypothetical protein